MVRKASRKSAQDSPQKAGAVTVRLDPKLKYLADLAARKQRRPLSGLIEWAVEESLSKVILEEDRNGDTSLMDAERFRGLWDVDEADRVAKLALYYPELLSYDEQIIWKLVRTNGLLWKGKYDDGTWTWKTEPEKLIWDRFREHWETFKAVAAGEKNEEELPTWTKDKASSDGWDSGDINDDIPF
ncbi:MAG: hypothetical protein RJS98_10820 [Rhodospirillaceae bacterium]